MDITKMNIYYNNHFYGSLLFSACKEEYLLNDDVIDFKKFSQTFSLFVFLKTNLCYHLNFGILHTNIDFQAYLSTYITLFN